MAFYKGGALMAVVHEQAVPFRRKMRSTIRTIGLIGFACICGAARMGAAEANREAIEVLRVRPNLYVMAGAGGNIRLQTGADGVVVVDAGVEPAADEVLAVIKSLTDQPIRYVIDTSADADHVGGNEKFARAGLTLFPLNDPNPNRVDAIGMTNGGAASVLAAEDVLLRVSAPTGQKAVYSTAARPPASLNQKRK